MIIARSRSNAFPGLTMLSHVAAHNQVADFNDAID
jgi:hypothetical protein